MAPWIAEPLPAWQEQELAKSTYCVLLVDDDEANLLSMALVLKKYYHVITASNGLNALEVIQQHQFAQDIHVIVADQRMPQMTGTTLLQKSMGFLPNAIRILLTAYTDVQALIQVINEGYLYKYLTKPIDPLYLEMQLRRALETYELRQQNFRLIRELQAFNTQLEEKIQARTQALEDELRQRIEAETALQASYQLIVRQQQEMQVTLAEARRTQRCLLPSRLPKVPGIRSVAKFVPMKEIGGDFYNLFALPEGKWGLMMADVTGHGVAAAMLAFMVSAAFFEQVRHDPQPQRVIRSTNELLYGHLPEDRFASIFYGVYDPEQKKLTYTNAGHPPALILREKTGEVFHLLKNGTIVGAFPDSFLEYQEASFVFQPGDKLLLYTDGLIEVHNSHKKIWGQEGLASLLSQYAQLPLPELLETLYTAGIAFSGHEYEDDVSMIALEWLQPPE